eukprot:363073-Chlamydomonas_euryale.AAC.7
MHTAATAKQCTSDSVFCLHSPAGACGPIMALAEQLQLCSLPVKLTRKVPPSTSAPRQFSTNLFTAALASGNASDVLRRAGVRVASQCQATRWCRGLPRPAAIR